MFLLELELDLSSLAAQQGKSFKSSLYYGNMAKVNNLLVFSRGHHENESATPLT